MKIAKYVGDLLYDYECVVIPGLGGFLADDKPVSINEVTHKFSPPFRKVHFNVRLRTNDGLLVNHVAQQEQIGYKIAKQRVDQFVFQCNDALNSGKKIKFQNIGSIYLDVDKNVVFAQDTKVNYNPDSFGLGSLVSPAIRRVTDEEKVKKVVKTAIDKNKTRKKPIDRKGKTKEEVKQAPEKKMQANRRKSTFTKNLIFLLVVGIVMGSGYLYMRKDAMEYYFDRYSSHIPFFYSSVNDYLSENINSTHVAGLSRSTASFFPTFLEKEKDPATIEVVVETIDNSENTGAPIETKGQLSMETDIGEIVEEVIVLDDNTNLGNALKTDATVNNVSKMDPMESTNFPEESSTVPAVATDRFFIIAGSFSNESNAKRLVSLLKSRGFGALIADTNKYGMFRVAFMTLNNRAEAENKLLAIRNEDNPKAWLLVK